MRQRPTWTPVDKNTEVLQHESKPVLGARAVRSAPLRPPPEKLADQSTLQRVHKELVIAAWNGCAKSRQRLEKTRLGGKIIPERFRPPTSTSNPWELICEKTVKSLGSHRIKRFVKRDDRQIALGFADGACHNNNNNKAAKPKAGCGLVAGPVSKNGFRLEKRGPTGIKHPQTSNRAELRAAIALLRMRSWVVEGFNTLIITTDSEYVFKGATEWVRSWIRHDWTNQKGKEVKDKDLWMMLLGEIAWWFKNGLDVLFWRISAENNIEADRLAEEGAGRMAVYREITDESMGSPTPTSMYISWPESGAGAHD